MSNEPTCSALVACHLRPEPQQLALPPGPKSDALTAAHNDGRAAREVELQSGATGTHLFVDAFLRGSIATQSHTARAATRPSLQARHTRFNL